ncbi:MAG: TRAP transporter TatT component family protein [Lysobacterales bacterium]
MNNFFIRDGRILALVGLLALAGCSKLVSSATNSFAGSLSAGILNQNDLQTVRDGAPAYLLLVDGFISDNPDNEALLLAGADLYGSYAGAFVDDEDRAKRLSDRARQYALRALCVRNQTLCDAMSLPFEAFETALENASDADDLEALFGFGAAWATWIQINSGDWNAIAEIPKVEAVMRRVTDINPAFRDGWPFLYLGVVTSQLPPAYGGKPDDAKANFQQALDASKRRNLMVQVLFASEYARLVFDQPLHDELLQEVLSADPDEPGLTLINTLAQQRAEQLLEQSAEYF